MSNYRLRQRLGGLLAVSFLILGGMNACVEVDNTFGEEYVPHDHQMELAHDATFQIATYNVTPDSIVSCMMPFNLLGSYVNETTGAHVHAGILFQMAPGSFANADSLYGTDAVIDSAFFHFSIWDYTGDFEKEQTFDIYPLTERILLDSVYYFDFDPSQIVAAEPLVSHIHKGVKSTIKIPVTDEAFFRELVDTTGYRSDSLFRERFKGFYITPRGNQDAAGYQIYLSSGSRLDAYYHNHNEKPDTNTALYSFAPYDYFAQYSVLNQSINVVKRDYTNIDPELALNDPATTTAKPIVESFGGIITKLHFTEGSIEALKEKVKEAGYTDIAINKAKLQIGYPSRDAFFLANFQERLGMYSDFSKQTGIVDFNWASEYNSIVQGQQFYPLAYDGNIKRTRFIYEMDITYYVQRLMRDDFDKYDVYLGPSYETRDLGSLDNWSNIHTTELSGSDSETPLKLVITYTMVR